MEGNSGSRMVARSTDCDLVGRVLSCRGYRTKDALLGALRDVSLL